MDDSSTSSIDLKTLFFSRSIWITLIFSIVLVYISYTLDLNWSLIAAIVLSIVYTLCQFFNVNIVTTETSWFRRDIIWSVIQVVLGALVLIWYIVFSLLNTHDVQKLADIPRVAPSIEETNRKVEKATDDLNTIYDKLIHIQNDVARYIPQFKLAISILSNTQTAINTLTSTNYKEYVSNKVNDTIDELTSLKTGMKQTSASLTEVKTLFPEVKDVRASPTNDVPVVNELLKIITSLEQSIGSLDTDIAAVVTTLNRMKSDYLTSTPAVTASVEQAKTAISSRISEQLIKLNTMLNNIFEGIILVSINGLIKVVEAAKETVSLVSDAVAIANVGANTVDSATDHATKPIKQLDNINIGGDKPVDVMALLSIVVGGIVVIITIFSSYYKSYFKRDLTDVKEKAAMDEYTGEEWDTFFTKMNNKQQPSFLDKVEQLFAKLSIYNNSALMFMLLLWVTTLMVYYYTSEKMEKTILRLFPITMIRHGQNVMMVFFSAVLFVLLFSSIIFLPFVRTFDPSIKGNFMDFIESVQDWQWKGFSPTNERKDKYQNDGYLTMFFRTIFTFLWSILWFFVTLGKTIGSGIIWAFTWGLHSITTWIYKLFDPNASPNGNNGPTQQQTGGDDSNIPRKPLPGFGQIMSELKILVDSLYNNVTDIAKSLIPGWGSASQWKFWENGMYLFRKNAEEEEDTGTNAFIDGRSRASFLKRILDLVGVLLTMIIGATIIGFGMFYLIGKGYSDIIISILSILAVIFGISGYIKYARDAAAAEGKLAWFDKLDSLNNPASQDDGPGFILLKLIWSAIKYIPCLLLDFIEMIIKQWNLTTRPIIIILLVEFVLIAGIFGAPYLVNYVVSKGSIPVVPYVNDLRKPINVSSLDEEGVFIFHNTADRRSKEDQVADCPPEQKKRFSYSVSGWFYIHSVTAGNANMSYKNILDVAGVPKITYNNATNNLRFTVKTDIVGKNGEVKTNENRILFETNPEKREPKASLDGNGNTRIIDSNGHTGFLDKSKNNAVTSDDPTNRPINKNSYKVIMTIDEELMNETIRKPSQIMIQKWNNFVINYDGNNMDIFINGELVSSNKNVIPNITNGAIITGDSDGIMGNICNVTFYNRVLNDSDVRWIYNSLKTLNPPTLHVEPTEKKLTKDITIDRSQYA